MGLSVKWGNGSGAVRFCAVRNKGFRNHVRQNALAPSSLQRTVPRGITRKVGTATDGQNPESRKKVLETGITHK